MHTNSPILVIDDEPFLRSTLCMVLHKVGYRTVEAQSGYQALGIIAAQPFGLVFLDLQLPDCDGLELLPQIRKIQPRTPVLVLTANGSLEKAIEALRMGAHEYLLKPVEPGQIITQVDDILRERQTSEEEFTTEDDSCGESSTEAGDFLEPEKQDLPQVLTVGNILLDMQLHNVKMQGKLINLPPCTFEYLVTLIRHAPQPVQYQLLVGESQGYWLSEVEAQDLAQWRIYRLRKAIEEDHNNPKYIISVPGYGYRFAAFVDQAFD